MSDSGFQHTLNASADVLENLLQEHMPSGVTWIMGPTSCSLHSKQILVHVETQTDTTVKAVSDTIPRKQLDSLRSALREILAQTLKGSTRSPMALCIMLLQISEEILLYTQDHSHTQDHSRKCIGWDAKSGNWESILDNKLGVDLLTVNDTAKFVLGKSITEILKCVPSGLRLLHVEPVFRHDLVARFARRRQEMNEHLQTLDKKQLQRCIPGQGRSVKDMAEYLSTPKVTFHGAPRAVMQSIVRYGFVMPGQEIGNTGMKVQVECGASFGYGIYSTPSIEYASTYARNGMMSYSTEEWTNPANVPGLRMVVCAVLMGRPTIVERGATRRTHGVFVEGADSHVSPNGMEYIVFDKAQIVPCYVLNLDFGASQARKHFDALGVQRRDKGAWKGVKLQSRVQPMTDDFSDTPAAKVAKKEAMKAAAAKWFPYGFGSAKGTNFVIEEVGDVSDDEEDYGDYQELRTQGEQDSHMSEYVDEKASWFDEFQTVRKTKAQVLVKRDE